MKQPSSSSLNQQVASTSTTTTTKTTLLASQIPTINTSKATRTNRSKLKSKSVSIIYSVLFLTSFTRVTVSSFTLPLPTAITTRTSSTAVAMTSRNLRNNNASLYKKHDDDDASNLYSNLLTSSSSLGVTRRVPHVHAMQMQSNSNDNHSRTSSNLNGNLNNKKGFSSSPGSNSNVNGNVSSNKRTGAGARTGSKRRQAAKTVSSLFSSFPLYFSKSSDGDIGDDSNMNGNSNDNGNSNGNTATISQLQQENKILRETISQLEDDNHRLEKRHAKQRIIVEQFEGEGYGDVVESAWWGQEGNGNANVNVIDDDSRAVTAPVASTKRHVQFGDPESQTLNLGLTHRERGMASAGDDRSRASSITTSSGQIPGQVQVQSFQIQDGLQEQEECDVDVEDDGGCPIEPDISFKAALKDRAYWLVGLLTLQSMSGLILARNELLLQTHPVIIYFLTMLVGAGGNAGNQAAVRVIRGIALGTLNERTQRKFLNREFKMAISLSVILSVAGFIRAVAFGTPFAETVAVTTALAIIVFTSICFGAVLPLLLRKINVDPAHSSTSIQVIMDILGVLLTVVVSTTVLDSPMGVMIIAKLTGK